MVESTQTIPNRQNDEISLKELILAIQDWTRYLWKKWLIIVVFGLTGSGLGLTYALLKAPTYVAKLTFVLEDSKSNPLGAYVGLANQLGIDLGSTSGSGIFSGDNILEFLKSRLMVEKTLLSPITIKDKTQSLAELYIEMNDLRKEWSKHSAFKDLQFPVNPDRKMFSLQQDSILYIMYNSIVKKNLNITKPDKKLSFISVECKATNETFSKAFTERIVKEATDFYVQTKTQRSKNAVNMLQAKADSIESLLNRKTYSVAASQDMNLNPARSVAGVNIELAARDKVVLQTMYAEVVKNLELSRMAMAQEIPIIQVVDTPILPLEKKRLGKLKGLMVGGIIGGLLSLLTLFCIRSYNRIINGSN